VSPITQNSFGPVGRCIYCGDTGGLRREHIMPYGLAGTMTLLDAVCKACEGATTSIDGYVLNNFLKNPRTIFNMPSRKGHPETLRVDTRTKKNIELPAKDCPSLMFLPVMNQPGLITGDGRGILRGMWMRAFNLDDGRLTELELKDFVSPTLDMHRFGQFVAKIAHAMSVATLGLDGFKPLLLELIRNKDVQPYDFVGGLPGPAPTTEKIHEATNRIIDVNGKIYVSAEIQLFSCFGAPRYQIVVGERLNAPPPEWLKTSWIAASAQPR